MVKLLDASTSIFYYLRAYQALMLKSNVQMIFT